MFTRGPVPNGSDLILERTISVHTVPFRLSTSVQTGPVCYCSVLNRSKKSSGFYQLSMRRIYVVAFQNGAEVPKGTGPGVYTVTDPSKGTGPGVYHGDGSVWDRNGSKNWTCFFGGPVFRPDRERIDGTVSRSHVNKRPIRHDFWIGTIWKPVPCEHSPRVPFSNVDFNIRGLQLKWRTENSWPGFSLQNRVSLKRYSINLYAL